QNAHPERMKRAAVVRHDLAEALRRALGGGAMRARGQEVVVAAPGDLLHGLQAERAGNPDRRMRALLRQRPRIDVAQRIMPPFVPERAGLGPGALNEVDRLPESGARLRLRDIVVERLRAAADRE